MTFNSIHPPRSALVNRTNIFTEKSLAPAKATHEYKNKLAKRPSSPVDDRIKKRVKTTVPDIEGESEDSDSCYESDSDMDADVANAARRSSSHFYHTHAATVGAPSGSHFRPSASLRPILESFVSSHKSDLYRFTSNNIEAYTTPPYACSFTNAAKRGGKPLLAVATEEGSVHLIDTSKRTEWDCEPSRLVFQPHINGIFGVSWNSSDNLLATCCGDKTTRISCPETGSLLYDLRGHTGTVKCAVWDPNHDDLLSTGGRDGTICIWDLRATKRQTGEDFNFGGPVLMIRNAHGSHNRGKGQGRKLAPLAKSVTSLLYLDAQPFRLVSSGSCDGILQAWDLRFPAPKRKAPKSPKANKILPSLISPIDPTVAHNSRPRGLTSLTLGSGRTAGLIFAMSTEARVHTYNSPDLVPQKNEYAHGTMKTDSFYVKIATSPCGNWLASGSNCGSLFLFDVSNSTRVSGMLPRHASDGVELQHQSGCGEIGALDWAEGALASCSDDGTVKIWRPDIDVYRECLDSPEEKVWEWTWWKGS